MAKKSLGAILKWQRKNLPRCCLNDINLDERFLSYVSKPPKPPTLSKIMSKTIAAAAVLGFCIFLTVNYLRRRQAKLFFDQKIRMKNSVRAERYFFDLFSPFLCDGQTRCGEFFEVEWEDSQVTVRKNRV